MHKVKRALFYFNFSINKYAKLIYQIANNKTL